MAAEHMGTGDGTAPSERAADPGAPSATPRRVGCLLCGTDTQPWQDVPKDWRRVGNPMAERIWNLRQCNACDFRFLHPRPAKEDVAEFYATDDYYTHQNDGDWSAGDMPLQDKVRHHLAWRLDQGAYLEPGIVAASVPMLTAGESSRVLDLGCGNGGLLKGLATLGYDVVGVEPDDDARAVASETGLTVYDGTAEDLPAELLSQRGTFDAVVMSHVLEHTLNPIEAVSAVVDLLAPGGLFICEVPNNACFEAERAGPRWSFLDVPRHLNFFTAQSLEAIMEKCRCPVQSRQYVGYARQFTPHRFDNERRIAEALEGKQVGEPKTLEKWRRFAGTALASDDAKYDSIRVLARKPK